MEYSQYSQGGGSGGGGGGSDKATSSASSATSGGYNFGGDATGGSPILLVAILGLSVFALLGLILISRK